ncbi:MAG: geranylgeranyl reductase family protein [Candidatus Heimdallarchaeota archaeon]
MEVDVLIVGLGPAGASAFAKLAELAGDELRILAIDKRAKPGFPVQCGEFMPSPKEMSFLMPEVPNAEQFFVFEDRFIGAATDKISFFSPIGKAIITPFEGYSINRGEWNAQLVKRGVKNGAEVWVNACAIAMRSGQVAVQRHQDKSPVTVNAKVIIGADGVNSRIAAWAGLDEKRGPNDFAICKEHLMEIPSESYDPTDVQMFFGREYSPGAYAWIIPKSDHTANVGTGARLPAMRARMTVSKVLNNLIEKHIIASKTLKGARILETIGGTVPVGLPFQRTVDLKKKILLLGDASCQVVSNVGGGIPTSMVAGAIAAQTISDHFKYNRSLANYEIEWQKQMLAMFKRAYRIRQFFDKISTGKDSRIQWYMNRLSSKNIDAVVHGRVPWKLKLAEPFVPFVNRYIN